MLDCSDLLVCLFVSVSSVLYHFKLGTFLNTDHGQYNTTLDFDITDAQE